MNPLEYLKDFNTVLKGYCEQKGYESTVEMDSFAGLVRIIIREDGDVLFDKKMDYREINICDELIDYIDQKINPEAVQCSKEPAKPYWTLEIVFRDNIKPCIIDVERYDNINGVLWYEERRKKETDDIVTVYIPLDRIACVTATEKFEEMEEKNDSHINS